MHKTFALVACLLAASAYSAAAQADAGDELPCRIVTSAEEITAGMVEAGQEARFCLQGDGCASFAPPPPLLAHARHIDGACSSANYGIVLGFFCGMSVARTAQRWVWPELGPLPP